MLLLFNFDLFLISGFHYVLLFQLIQTTLLLNEVYCFVLIFLQLQISVIGFTVYVRYQNESGKFCCLLLFSLNSGKPCDVMSPIRASNPRPLAREQSANISGPQTPDLKLMENSVWDLSTKNHNFTSFQTGDISGVK